MPSLTEDVKRAARQSFAKAGLSIKRLPDRHNVGYHVAEVARFYDADVVLDVGANTGQFARALRASNYAGPLISFEPVPEPFGTLHRRADGDRNWTVRQLALGEERGTAAMNITQSSSVSSFLRPTDDYQATYNGRITRTEEVEISTLDAEIGPTPYQRIFLKIDTQGFDLKVLAGAKELMPRIIGIAIELSVIPIDTGSPDYIEALRLMRDLGFTPSGIFPVQADERLRMYEFDGVFVHA